MNKVILITGPTASGKTNLSLELSKLAHKLEATCEIVNFDSIAMYRELNIGAAKPSREERQQVPHHLIDCASIFDPINAADFVLNAKKLIQELHKKNIIPILVGGSPFYVRALIKGMYLAKEAPEAADAIKQELKIKYETSGIEYFSNFLQKNDLESYQHLHPNDHYRIMRAVEHFQITGTPISLERKRKEAQDPYDFRKNTENDWHILHLHLDMPKEDHFKYITNRTKKMLAQGLVKEVEDLLKNGAAGTERPLASVGYKETLGLLRGELKDDQELENKINIATRQLAKAQRTYFKKFHDKHLLNPHQPDLFTRLTELLKHFVQT